MAQPRKQFEETFALVATDPGAWVEQAQGMRIAAEPILQNLLEILYQSQTIPGIRLKRLAYVRAYMLLMGFAFENLLKAIVAKRGLLRTNPDLLIDQSVKQAKGGHSLTRLAESLELALSPGEKKYLRRVEEYIHWAGRYPVSNRRGIYVEGHSTQQLSFTSRDPKLGSELFDRLARLAESSE